MAVVAPQSRDRGGFDTRLDDRWRHFHWSRLDFGGSWLYSGLGPRFNRQVWARLRARLDSREWWRLWLALDSRLGRGSVGGLGFEFGAQLWFWEPRTPAWALTRGVRAISMRGTGGGSGGTRRNSGSGNGAGVGCCTMGSGIGSIFRSGSGWRMTGSGAGSILGCVILGAATGFSWMLGDRRGFLGDNVDFQYWRCLDRYRTETGYERNQSGMYHDRQRKRHLEGALAVPIGHRRGKVTPSVEGGVRHYRRVLQPIGVSKVGSTD